MAKEEKAVTVTAVKNIPLSMIARGNKEMERDPKVKRGGRVERGTKITVSEDKAKALKDIGYAK